MTWKITVQAVTYHSYFFDDDDHDGDDYAWTLAHTSDKMTETFGWSAPGEKAIGFNVLTAAVSRKHGVWSEADDGDMVWVADPESEEPWDQIATLTKGMTTERWMTEVEAIEVAIAKLIPTQPGVFFHTPVDRLPVGGDLVPHAVEVDGLIYIEDGHHRIVRAALRGLTSIQVRVMRPRKMTTQEDECYESID